MVLELVLTGWLVGFLLGWTIYLLTHDAWSNVFFLVLGLLV